MQFRVMKCYQFKINVQWIYSSRLIFLVSSKLFEGNARDLNTNDNGSFDAFLVRRKAGRPYFNRNTSPLAPLFVKFSITNGAPLIRQSFVVIRPRKFIQMTVLSGEFKTRAYSLCIPSYLFRVTVALIAVNVSHICFITRYAADTAITIKLRALART